jgi:hypothetical protein
VQENHQHEPKSKSLEIKYVIKLTIKMHKQTLFAIKRYERASSFLIA